MSQVDRYQALVERFNGRGLNVFPVVTPLSPEEVVARLSERGNPLISSSSAGTTNLDTVLDSLEAAIDLNDAFERFIRS